MLEDELNILDKKSAISFIPRDIEPGITIGPYQILEKLGAGGMGVVYKAYQANLQRTVAIKMILSQTSELSRKRFLREAKINLALEHPSIPKIYHAYLAEHIPYIVMQFIPGKNLREYVQKNSCSLKDRVQIVLSIALALGYAHEHGVLHRDVKPANILITQSCKPYLMDFGLAKLMEDSAVSLSTNLEILTKPGDMVIGSIKYISPEQASGIELDARSDVYSLGTVLYEMLTGRTVVSTKSKNFLQILNDIINSPTTRPRDFNNEVPEELERICLKALEKDREKRYANAQEIAQELGKFVGENIREFKKRPSRRMKKIKRRRIMLSLCLGLLIILAAVYLLSKS